jgi:hypothetical protein
MHFTLDDDEVELLVILIDINLLALRRAIESDIEHPERAIHQLRLISLQGLRAKLVGSLH